MNPTYTPHTGPVNPSHEGNRAAKLFVLAESPWFTEIKRGRPLVGASGLKWEEWLMKAGISRQDIRIENLYPFKPKERNIGSVANKEILHWMLDLHKRIAALPGDGPNVIVTMGNYATFALTGKGKVKAAIRNAFSEMNVNTTEAEKKAGITSLRGSIYLYQDYNGRQIKVIPTIHPAGVLQMDKWGKRCIADWKRIAEEMKSKEYTVPHRKHIVDPEEWQVAQYTKFVEQNACALDLAVDIETWGRTLSCVGFAYTPHESLTINTLTKEKKRVFLPYVKRLCECQAAKVLCNGSYDWYWLDESDIQLSNFLWDVQLMHHAFDPVETHALEFLASIYTKQPYWKDEAKDAEEIIKYAKKAESLWVYNGIDCCVTHEIKPIFVEILREKGLYDFYFNHYQRMIEPLLRMSRHGVRVDKEKQKAWRRKLLKDMVEIRDELEAKAGENLFAIERKTALREPTKEELDLLIGEGEIEIDPKTNAPKSKFVDRVARQKLIEEKELTYMIGGKNAGKMRFWKEIDRKDFSPVKLHKFFYETLGLPVQKKRRKGKKEATDALDEAAIRKMNEKWPHKIGNYGNLLLLYREKKKEADYLKGAWDSDGRIRCSYKMITEAGRLASAKNPMGKGFNLQNLKR
jgi:uracil-DNA glycosylase family 4